MRIAEQVTFGGSGYDRAAELRAQAESVWQDPRTRVMVLWRGKPMVTASGERKLFTVDTSHPILRDAGPTVFLGKPDGVPLFVIDLTGWEPEGTHEIGGFIDTSEQVHPTVAGDAAFAELRAIMLQLSAQEAELATTAKAILGWHHTHQFCSRCGEESVLAQGGWQRNCPSCKGAHFPRTDPVVIMLVTRGNSVLLGRSPGWPEKMYSCLAGFIEPGETIEAAVRREVFEETSIKCGAITYLSSQPWAFPTNLMIGCQTEALTNEIILDPAELEDARWVSREELAMAFAGEHPEISPARLGSIAQFLLVNWLADNLD